MKIAIIGAGFGGLAAGYYLAKRGVDVTIFEFGDKPGGLAVGFKEPKWKWSLEKHYHHWFTNDFAVLSLAEEIGHKVYTVRPRTSTFIDGRIYQLDSVGSLLTFSELALVDRVRTGLVLSYLKSTPSWKRLETVTAEKFIKKWMGEASWKVLWQPLFEKKFGKYSNKIPASWFWARIKKRTPSLAYPERGFLAFAEHLNEKIFHLKGKVLYKTQVKRIRKGSWGFEILAENLKYEFDKVVCTLPSYLFAKIASGFPNDYVKKLLDMKGVGAVNLLLSLNKQFLEDGSYWLNVTSRHFPFLAVVEHTNFMDKKYYNNERLVYVGNYLPHDHKYYKYEAVALIREFYPYLKTINPKFDKSWINKAYLFKAPFAQPIIPPNYSSKIPKFETPIEGLYLCNIEQVYPWDRGTNYAVQLGKKAAEIIVND